MPLNDVKRVKNPIMYKHRSITSHQSNSKFSSTQHARFHQLTRMNSAFNRFESTTLRSLG